jgi:hypothetical protein
LPPSVDSAPAREAIEREIGALEDLCATIERALLSRDWDAFAVAMSDSRRVTHALQNAMADAVSARDAVFDASVFDRARRVYAIRENQLARLRTYNLTVGEKLSQIGTLKRFAKRIGAKNPPSRLASLDHLS